MQSAGTLSKFLSCIVHVLQRDSSVALRGALHQKLKQAKGPVVHACMGMGMAAEPKIVEIVWMDGGRRESCMSCALYGIVVGINLFFFSFSSL
jgi:hypothetical protein